MSLTTHNTPSSQQEKSSQKDKNSSEILLEQREIMDKARAWLQNQPQDISDIVLRHISEPSDTLLVLSIIQNNLYDSTVIIPAAGKFPILTDCHIQQGYPYNSLSVESQDPSQILWLFQRGFISKISVFSLAQLIYLPGELTRKIVWFIKRMRIKVFPAKRRIPICELFISSTSPIYNSYGDTSALHHVIKIVTPAYGINLARSPTEKWIPEQNELALRKANKLRVIRTELSQARGLWTELFRDSHLTIMARSIIADDDHPWVKEIEQTDIEGIEPEVAKILHSYFPHKFKRSRCSQQDYWFSKYLENSPDSDQEEFINS